MKKSNVLLGIIIISLCLIVSVNRQVEASEIAERYVTAIELPQNLNFYLDPQNENGRGQIYSDKYIIRNTGEEPVDFSIEMQLSLLDEQSDIRFCSEQWYDEHLDKTIYMYAIFERDEEETYVLTGEGNSCIKNFILEPTGENGDTVYISFGGMLGQAEDWKSGELAIHALYTMSAKPIGCQVKIEGAHIELKNPEEVLEKGKSAELYLMTEEGYFFPGEIQVYMGENEAEFVYDTASGKIFVDNVTDDVMIYADGITMAPLPDFELINDEESVWAWSVDEGIQAYEYTFLQDDINTRSGRVSVENGSILWNWSEGLEDGKYQLRIRAIGDTVHCLNSEEASYWVVVSRDLLQPPKEDIEGNDTILPLPSENPNENEHPQPTIEPGENDKTPLPSGGNNEECGTPAPTELPKEDEVFEPTTNPEEGGMLEPTTNPVENELPDSTLNPEEEKSELIADPEEDWLLKPTANPNEGTEDD